MLSCFVFSFVVVKRSCDRFFSPTFSRRCDMSFIGGVPTVVILDVSILDGNYCHVFAMSSYRYPVFGKTFPVF